MLDVVFGTIDRELLNVHDVAPERQLWWDLGVDWIQRLTTDRVDHLTKYPGYEASDVVQVQSWC